MLESYQNISTATLSSTIIFFFPLAQDCFMFAQKDSEVETHWNDRLIHSSSSKEIQ